MTYAFTNPTAADLVDSVEEWPGVTTLHATLSGGHITATRPKHFFRDDGEMPEVVSLPIARPCGFDNLGQEEWANLVTERVRAKEADTASGASPTASPCLAAPECLAEILSILRLAIRLAFN
jgi:hypothetical protein